MSHLYIGALAYAGATPTAPTELSATSCRTCKLTVIYDYDRIGEDMKLNHYCRAWYKGKKRKTLERLVSLLAPFSWSDCSELSQIEQDTARKTLKEIYAIFVITPFDKKKVETIEEQRYIEILMRALKYLLRKDYWNCCHELSDLFELEPVFQPHIAYATQKLLEMAVK